MAVNISSSESLAEMFRVLGQPARLDILQVIGTGSACVCHLEAYLGYRQALISQHLMVLRQAGLVQTEREGRNIYYRLKSPDLMTLVLAAAKLAGLDPDGWAEGLSQPRLPCPCPHCNPGQAGIVCSPPVRGEETD